MNTLVEKLNGLQPHLLSKIKGQDNAIERVCSVLERGQLGLQPPDKPLGSMLFLGPTGVGKTELTLEFSRYLFGEGAVFRFDMSEFLHADSVKLFIGDESGRTGRLGKILAENRKGVLLFDEIEKAHRSIWDLFLQMLDTARITLADNRTHDLSEFYIICTSNVGSQHLLRPTRLPFATLERAVISELHRAFRPELVGRFEERLVFKPLSQQSLREISAEMVSEELTQLAERGFTITISEAASEFLLRRCHHKTLGARPMKAQMRKHIGDAIRQSLKSTKMCSGVLCVSTAGDRLSIVPESDAQFRHSSSRSERLQVNRLGSSEGA